MNTPRLRDFTIARVGVGRVGHSLPTRELLDFQLAHARARDAVHAQMDPAAMAREMAPIAGPPVLARSQAHDRATYLRRPDLGRKLNAGSRERLAAHAGHYDLAFAVVDGLSAFAVERHSAPLLSAILARLDPAEWAIAPLTVVEQGRVAIGDDIANTLGAALVVVLIGERPGLSSPDSLGVYLTWNPQAGVSTDAGRNCISNIRTEGLDYAMAAHKLHFLITEARRRKLSGVNLKEDAALPSPNERPSLL